jgi:hypothetical protein
MILITELTFVARSHRREKIHKYGHVHIDDCSNVGTASATRW